MTGTNGFLPFAYGSGANVLSDADYASALSNDGQYATGVTQGRASSQQANKTWLQGTLMASVLGQIIANMGQDASDSQSVATLSQNLVAAFRRSSLVLPFDATFATLIGGYPSKSIVADPNTSGVYWISTTDDNLTTPGASGASWVSLFAPVQQGRLLGTTRITSSTTYVPPAGTRYVEVDLGGAGGGSGGVPAPANSSQVNVSTGGNAGSFLKVTITDPSVFTNAPVVIGGYGQGGAIGTHDGVPGGTTSFANYSAPGGAGGKTTTVTAFPFAGLATGASPGSPSAGDIAYVGAAPTGWIAISPTVGVTSIGGASPWGPGGYAAIGIDGGAQGAAGGFGAGAGGVMAPGNYTQGLAGANGGQGYCVVRAYS